MLYARKGLAESKVEDRVDHQVVEGAGGNAQLDELLRAWCAWVLWNVIMRRRLLRSAGTAS
jgi:hypothetical protein